jgi:hypothetical protein
MFLGAKSNVVALESQVGKTSFFYLNFLNNPITFTKIRYLTIHLRALLKWDFLPQSMGE